MRLVGGLNDCGMPTTESQCEAAVQHREDRERDGKQPPTPCPSTLRSRAVSHNTAYTAAHHGEMDAGTRYRLVHRPPHAGRACGRRTLHISPSKAASEYAGVYAWCVGVNVRMGLPLASNAVALRCVHRRAV